MAMRNWKSKVRHGKDRLGNLAAEEGLARAMGEYCREATPNYVRERREFEKNVREDIKRRQYGPDTIIVVRRSS